MRSPVDDGGRTTHRPLRSLARPCAAPALTPRPLVTLCSLAFCRLRDYLLRARAARACSGARINLLKQERFTRSGDSAPRATDGGRNTHRPQRRLARPCAAPALTPRPAVTVGSFASCQRGDYLSRARAARACSGARINSI